MISSSSGWAVGDGGAIVRWDGTKWSQVLSPIATKLEHVSCFSATNCWAVGYAPAAGGEGTIIHWNGAQWTRVPGPVMGAGGFLRSIHMLSPTDGWAVGLNATNG